MVPRGKREREAGTENPELRHKGIGAFIVQYTFSPQPDKVHDLLRTDIVANTKIIPLDGKVIERRMEQHLGPAEK